MGDLITTFNQRRNQQLKKRTIWDASDRVLQMCFVFTLAFHVGWISAVAYGSYWCLILCFPICCVAVLCTLRGINIEAELRKRELEIWTSAN